MAIGEGYARFYTKRGIPPMYHESELTVELAPNMLLRGDNGTGKTYQACAVLIHCYMTYQSSIGFVTANNYLREIRSTFGKHSTESDMDVFERYAEVDRLVIDDIGAEKVGEFGLAEILALVDHRVSYLKATTITTNLTLQEIHELEPRLASRLASFDEIVMDGKDRRMQ